MPMTKPSQDTLYLVDASGFIFRAFHALPPLTVGAGLPAAGTPVGAVVGFVNMMLRLLRDLEAKHVGVVFDAARRNFRNDIYPEYKANRDETPPDLIPQFPLIREATRAFGFVPLEQEGYEADDLIAAYARAGREAGLHVVIVSSDKDLMQLVRDRVSMFDPIKQKPLGAAEVLEKFGVAPEKVVDVQALCGDATDNVPGVRGIGVKTAAELINQFGTLETLLESLNQIKQPKRRETLIENAELARISKKLVRLDDAAPLPQPIENLGSGAIDSSALVQFLSSYGFKSALARLGKPSSPAPVQTIPEQAQDPVSGLSGRGTYSAVTDARTLADWVAISVTRGVVAVDTETTSLTPAKAELVGISLSCEAGSGIYVPVGHRAPGGNLLDGILAGPGKTIMQMTPADALAILRPLLEDPAVLKVGHNIKYDLQMFAAHGVNVAPIDDTMLISYVLDGSSHGHGMDELASLHLGHQTIHYEDVCGKGAKQISFAEVPIARATEYAAEDADITLRLHALLKPRLAREHMVSVYETMDRPLVPVIARMEEAGIKIDTHMLARLSQDFGTQIAQLESDIHQLAGHPFNVASPRQLGIVLFDEMGLEGGGKTKGGDWSTTADILEELAAQGHAIVQKVLDYRQLAKLKSTYTDALQAEINKRTGRVHTSFALAHTSTGRLASSDPNLQNIPIRTDNGKKIREAFVAREGYRLISVDYSQIELRLAASMAEVPALKQAFIEGADIHALTASQVFEVPLEQMTPDIRRRAKAINFGIIYGISGWGLARQLGIEPAQAQAFIKAYFTRFPELPAYMERIKEEARRQGFVRTLFGRKCFIDGINDKGARRAFAERQAINAPLQGTAADIMKRAMVRVERMLAESNLECRMLLQVHDELVFEARTDQAEDAANAIRQVMESRAVADIGLPLIAEAGIGDTWGRAH
ncbi:MAG: DNA polymerase I [Rhodospirillales bacterium]|nr:DNA polymerase I [Rhodospirillales bacterium]USO07054.1 MAG: DNA polymerase I [Rhodospirillales bacterium]